MMSLFSSFDTFFFYLTPFSIALGIFMLFSLSFKFCSFSFIHFSIILELGKFFSSLKNKNLNKISLGLFFSCIFLVFVLNFCSVFSFNFPVTSQFGVVMYLSLIFWVSFILFSLANNYKGFFSHLIPEGTPLPLTILLYLIELISNSIRPITLTVRLVANILAGHLLMILLYKLISSFPPTFIFYVFLNSVELFVALIQSYIYCTMIALYFSEVC